MRRNIALILAFVLILVMVSASWVRADAIVHAPAIRAENAIDGNAPLCPPRLCGEFLSVLITGDSLLITPTPTSLALGPVNVATPTATPIPPDDPRPAICSAPYQPGFAPHIVRPGERLADLVTGSTALTITQIAALNCLDDPSALPVGAVIWLPVASGGDAVDVTPVGNVPVIASFTVSEERAQNFAGVTFRWQASGEAAYLYPCNPDLQIACVRPLDAQPLPWSFTTPVISGFRYAGPARYRLEVVVGTQTATEDITFEVVCSQPPLGAYSGLQPCPDEPARPVTGAIQPFERGVMIWFAETRMIWVLTDDGRVQVVPDPYAPDAVTPTDEPPPERYLPVRGFGIVWAQLGGAEGTLGWATAPEALSEFMRQPAGRFSYTVYLQPQGGDVYAVTILPEASEGYWALVSEA